MKTVIISLGGSVIIPDKADISFLRGFKKLITSFTKKYRFIIYCGGGKLARNLQEKGRKAKLADKDLDWLGIYATRLNAILLKNLFGDSAEKEMIINPTKKITFTKKVILAAGWKPGWSTDYDAVLAAKNLGAEAVINVTNVDYVYDSDPRKNKDAKPIKEISWKDFRKLISGKWEPGLNAPFDPIAAKEAEKSGLKVVIAGRSLKNLKDILENRKIKGTVIHS